MAEKSSFYASQLRLEIGLRNRAWAAGRAHAESYGDPPVIVYEPEEGRHGNFYDPAYAAILARPEWLRRFDKIHAQGRALPRAESGRRWRELDSSMSSDALLMNIFCTPAMTGKIRKVLGVELDAQPVFGWKARVPLANGRFDRTEVDMRWGDLLVEAKLTEADFQSRTASVVEAYRDFDAVFDRERLQRVELPTARRREAVEFPEDYSQEYEESGTGAEPGESPRERQTSGLTPGLEALIHAQMSRPTQTGYASYQLIRNVLAAHASGCSFCVLHDARRSDLREEWFAVMSAVKSAELRVRCKTMSWQELAASAPQELKSFLDEKYGIVSI
jgi:hypothetical protein